MTNGNNTKLKETLKKIRCFTIIRINVLALFFIAFGFLLVIYYNLSNSIELSPELLKKLETEDETIKLEKIMVGAKEAFTLMKELMLVLITGVVAVVKDLVD